MASKTAILAAFLSTRWRQRRNRAQIERHQLAALRRLPRDLPLTTPAEFAAQFAKYNVLGLTLEQARGVAQREIAGEPSPYPGFSFGLSTGTSGEPGVFLTTAAERNRWIGTILAKCLSLRQLRSVDVALLLKHNNRLYTDVAATGRVRLHYFDLTQPVEQWAHRLCALAPGVLVGPPSALCAVATSAAFTHKPFYPETLLAGAEPFFPQDTQFLTQAFHTAPRSLYQAKEGFLGAACIKGNLHLNEDLIAFEAMRFAEDPRRVVPVITDFSRQSQTYWRYRMDDVLLLAEAPCDCGSQYRAVHAVEGRLQDVFLRTGTKPLFPLDANAILQRHLDQEATLQQHDLNTFTVSTNKTISESLRQKLQTELQLPHLAIAPFKTTAPGEKRRRFQRLFDPSSESINLLPPGRWPD
jgi:putative adenylate-forming enzyme